MSGQAMMGTLVKRHLAPQWGADPARVYHCAIMPCYDKKLEASREDFNLPGGNLLCLQVLACLFLGPWTGACIIITSQQASGLMMQGHGNSQNLLHHDTTDAKSAMESVFVCCIACSGTSIPEVDSVLTSGEVQQLLEQHGANLGACPEAPWTASCLTSLTMAGCMACPAALVRHSLPL